MSRASSSKGVVFIAVMSALGNVLSFLSITISPIVPSIPFGPISVSLALDLSHLTTFIAALFGGPAVGGLTGMIGGLVAAYEFGFSKGNLITGFGLPLGKAMTGVTAGLLMGRFSPMNRRGVMMVPVTVASYVPEGVFTALLFILVFPSVLGLPVWLVNMITTQILVKAFFEMVVMGLILAAFLRNHSFTEFARGFFA